MTKRKTIILLCLSGIILMELAICVCQSDSEFIDCESGLNCSPNDAKEFKKDCYLPSQRCNLIKDCINGSDEQDCEFAQNCSEFECNLAPKNCIPKTWACDGQNDCGDFSDEFPSLCGAGFECPAHMFTCANMNCVRKEFQCDGTNDCGDYSDELNCTQIPDCPNNGVFCKPTNSCIEQKRVCNNFTNCPDSSDENTTFCSDVPQCKGYKCKNDFEDTDLMECIDAKQVCDGYADCMDEDDEGEQCFFTCKPGYERCLGSFQCVKSDKFCDRVKDCANGFDENMFCRRNLCLVDNGGCEQICESYPPEYFLAKCACLEGYRLANHTRCIDIDECQEVGTCSQICYNYNGGYECSCEEGYNLIERKHCRVNEQDGTLLVLNTTVGRGVDILHGRRPDQLFTSLSTVPSHVFARNVSIGQSIGYDTALEHLYFVAKDNRSIVRLLAKWQKTIVQAGKILALSIDWVSGKIYWTQSGNRIMVSTMDGTITRTLMRTDEQPQAIVVVPDSSVRSMYWIESGRRLRGSSMDGQADTLVTLHTHPRMRPWVLTVDTPLNTLYFVLKNTLYTIDVEGKHLRTVMVRLPSAHSLTIFQDWLIWLEDHYVVKMDKFNNRSIHRIARMTPTDRHVFVNHSTAQPKFENPCHSGVQCSHLCLLSRHHGYTCGCPDDVEMLSDAATCNTAEAYMCGKGFCLNGGECVLEGFVKCQCARGYSGRRCEREPVSSWVDNLPAQTLGGKCTSWYCLNGGECVHDFPYLITPYCRCPDKFKGPRCEQKYLKPTVGGLNLALYSIAGVLVVMLLAIGVWKISRYTRVIDRLSMKKKEYAARRVESRKRTSTEESVIRSEVYVHPEIMLHTAKFNVRRSMSTTTL